MSEQEFIGFLVGMVIIYLTQLIVFGEKNVERKK